MNNVPVISIIGGGLSGSLVALNIIRQATEPVHVKIIENSGKFGLGAAYSTDKDYHLLNVPAHKMGAYAGDVEDFYLWVQENNFSYKRKAFVPRKIYGQYIQSLLKFHEEKFNSLASLEKITAEIIDIKPNEEGILLQPKNGKLFYTDKVVLAVGNYAPADPFEVSYNESLRYFANPWNLTATDYFNKDETIFIIGTGLTMVDMLLTLHQNGHKGKIIALSKHGYLPAEHKELEYHPDFELELFKKRSINHYYSTVREAVKKASFLGLSWHGVISSIRPHTQQLWMRLPKEDKKRFMRHLNSLWTVLRHRMAPEVAAIINEMKQSNQLEIISGRIKNIHAEVDKVSITYRKRYEKVYQTIEAGKAINCTGIHHDFSKINHPLVKSLYEQSLVRNDELSIGLDVDLIGALINKEGVPSKSLFAIGPPTKGVFWEITAVPEIRTQAARLATKLLFK